MLHTASARIHHRLPSRPRPQRSRYQPRLEPLEAREMLSASTGTWTPLVNPDPVGAGTMMLLPSGKVMLQGANVTASWEQLAPDASGSFINGSFSALTAMHTQRLYFASNVLQTGNVFVLGGEYTNAGAVWTNTSEMFNPGVNKWANKATFPQSQFGDDPSQVMPNGQVLVGYLSGPQTYLYDSKANTFTQTGTKLRGDRSDEETWAKLPDGSILSYDIFSSISTGVGTAQRYVPATGAWVDTGIVPVPLTSSSLGYELGPAMLLPDGRVLQIGANSNTAIYTPSTNSWVAGPVIPGGFGADDAPAAILPDGNILFAADQPLFNTPTALFDFDSTTNTITQVTVPTTLGNELSATPSYPLRMLMLPTGQLLLTTSGTDLWAYTPDQGPNASWQPKITGETYLGNFNFGVRGTQLNGMSEGASYGDDAEMSENYPIVRLSDTTGNVFYAQTSNWSNTGVQTGTLSVNTRFKLPAGMPAGTYSLVVSASGITSNPITVTITADEIPPVTAPFNSITASPVAADHLIPPPSAFPGSNATSAAGFGTGRGGEQFASVPASVVGSLSNARSASGASAQASAFGGRLVGDSLHPLVGSLRRDGGVGADATFAAIDALFAAGLLGSEL